MCIEKLLFVSLLQLCDFNDPSSKPHISGYNHRRNPKLGLTELYGNNILKGQLIWLNHLWDIEDQKRCVFLRHPVYGNTVYIYFVIRYE